MAQTKNEVSTDRFVHLSGRGIFAQEDNAGAWVTPLLDGLGSTRMVVNDTLGVDSIQSFAPYGEPLEAGSFGSPFTFTGEMTDANDLLYLRARYYSPALGVFTGLDPMEGDAAQAMSLNRYGYVAGNVVNAVDPSGMFAVPSPRQWDPCAQISDPCYEHCVQEVLVNQSPLAQLGYDLSGLMDECIQDCHKQDFRFALRSYADSLYGCLSTQFPGDYPTSLGKDCDLPESDYPSGSVDALVKMMKYGAKIDPEISSKELVGEMSRILLGTSGRFTVLNQVLFSATDDHPLAREGGVGFHSDYYESAGQVHHFWAYLDTVAQGGEAVAYYADIFHECVQEGGTVEDARLSSVAFRLGEAVRNGVSVSELAQAIERSLGENGVGFGGVFAGHYYDAFPCRSKLEEWGYDPNYILPGFP